jgi:hypothetical protein
LWSSNFWGECKTCTSQLRTMKGYVCNHGNHTIIVWQLKPYSCNNGSHTCTHCFNYSNHGKQCNHGSQGTWFTVVKNVA